MVWLIGALLFRCWTSTIFPTFHSSRFGSGLLRLPPLTRLKPGDGISATDSTCAWTKPAPNWSAWYEGADDEAGAPTGKNAHEPIVSIARSGTSGDPDVNPGSRPDRTGRMHQSGSCADDTVDGLPAAGRWWRSASSKNRPGLEALRLRSDLGRTDLPGQSGRPQLESCPGRGCQRRGFLAPAQREGAADHR